MWQIRSPGGGFEGQGARVSLVGPGGLAGGARAGKPGAARCAIRLPPNCTQFHPSHKTVSNGEMCRVADVQHLSPSYLYITVRSHLAPSPFFVSGAFLVLTSAPVPSACVMAFVS
jgi:hypothetical protein